MIIRELFIKLGLAGASNVEGGFKRIDTAAQHTISTLNIFGGVLTGVMGALSIASIARVGDEMQNLRSQIGNSTGDMAGATDQLDNLTKHANDGRVSVESYAGSWAKMNSGIKQFGGTSGDTTKFMDPLSAVFVSNGTATESANAALFQLSQTMQGGQVQGEEMNSLIDAQGELYQDIAKAIGGTGNNYKTLQKQGKVTSEMLLNAVNQFYDKYTARVKNMPMTIAQANTIIANRWKQFVDKINRNTGFISKIADSFLWVADKVEYAMGIISDAMGGTSQAIKHLIQVATPLAGVVTLLAGFGILTTVLTSPITLILALATAIGILYDDYKTWKDGGDSLLNWTEWNKQLEGASTAIRGLTIDFGKLTKAVTGLIAIDPANWTLKDYLQGLVDNVTSLIKSLTSVTTLLDGLLTMNWDKIKAGISGVADAAMKGPLNPTRLASDAVDWAVDSGKSFFSSDNPVTQRPSWWPELLGGPGAPLIPQVSASSMAGLSSAAQKTSVDQKITYSPQNTFYLQPAGSDGSDFSASIQQGLNTSYQDFTQRIGNDLQYNVGAK